MKNALCILAASILVSALALCWAVKTAVPDALDAPDGAPQE